MDFSEREMDFSAKQKKRCSHQNILAIFYEGAPNAEGILVFRVIDLKNKVSHPGPHLYPTTNHFQFN